MANVLTGFRIICSVALLFVRAFSTPFYALYLTAGITDILDGIAARRLNEVSSFGSKFDTIADAFFTVVCLFKLIPALEAPAWLLIWVAVIALIKAANFISGFVIYKSPAAEHTAMNKAVGVMLFIFPLIMPIIDFERSAFVLCAAASFAAIQEGIYIKKGKFVD